MERVPRQTKIQTRMQRYRDAMRARGMRPVQIWVPDTRSDAFLHEARRQSEAVNLADAEDGTMDWLEAVGDFDDPR